jgi:hypothetical protein
MSAGFCQNVSRQSICILLPNKWDIFFWVGCVTALPVLIQRRVDDGMMNECGVVGGMRTSRGERSTGTEPAPVPLCSPQIPHDLTRDRRRAAAVESQLLTVTPVAQPTDVSVLLKCLWQHLRHCRLLTTPLRARGSGLLFTAFGTKYSWQILQIVYRIIVPGQ